MPNGVSCSVSSCTFWENNNRCTADFIHIKTDEEVESFNEEFSSELTEANNVMTEKARDSVETCCQTFRPKDYEDE